MVMIASGHDTREPRAHERCLSRSSGETRTSRTIARKAAVQSRWLGSHLGTYLCRFRHYGTNSHHSVSRRLLRFLQLFGESGHDFENVCDHAVIGDLEDGRVLVFVYRHNRARALHADNVLNRAADSQGEIQFRRHRLAGTADLTIHRQPALVADWT